MRIKKITSTLIMGLALTLGSAAFAQKAQNESPKESCCAMPTCCCKGDSCPAKKAKNHSSKNSAKESCCCSCCSGDSCELKEKDKQDKTKGN